MSDVVKMKKGEEKKATSSQKLSEFLAKNRVALLVALCVIVAGVIGYAIAISVYQSKVKKNLGVIEMIEFSLTKDSADLEESVVASRLQTALSNVEPYLKKGGIVGARADMLAADIYMQKNDWGAAHDLWLAAAGKCKKSYLASICNFNVGVCAEEMGQKDKALEFYTKVCDDVSFVNRSRAYFNAARVKESLGDYDGARASYEAIATLSLSNDVWNDLAQSRLIALRAEGKIQ